MKNNFYPVVSVVGTTSVGKTDFAFALAEVLVARGEAGVDIISADSRQIYQGLDVITGADIPEGYEKKFDQALSPFPYYEKGAIRLHGVSILPVSAEWSVSQFQEYAQELIEKAQLFHRKVIVVGGTGLYHQHLFTIDNRLHIPPNQALREKAATLSVAELQHWLKGLDSEKLESMNNSDRNNPRRLIRALEIATAVPKDTERDSNPVAHTYLGLTAPLESVLGKIEQRVIKRLTRGALEEVQRLRVAEHVAQQVWSTLGVQLVIEYLENKLTKEELIYRWTVEEKNYAKRQVTWWKARQAIEWFDVSQLGQREAALEFALQKITND